MTPSDCFLHLLGEGAILSLLVMLRHLSSSGVQWSGGTLHLHLLSRTGKMEQRWRTHVQPVMQTGALHVSFKRQSFSRGMTLWSTGVCRSSARLCPCQPCG
ncbi:hypothetical protein SAMN00790413_06117 [Deinococcus hopiensis KR-140]|uniref:Uncharacterized protein n=1 Tax=Deinococcus hopiensis KR-140 TaxID=695939 RepID=A0A1W1VXS5_9DEIO|nr:hypothetical protein SAMN00790413_06117 [Deinococcus hopiensis KR-140]